MKVGFACACVCVCVYVRSRNVTDDRSLQVAIGLMDKFFPRVIFIGTTEAGYPRLSANAFQRGEGRAEVIFFPARRAFAEAGSN